MASEYEKELEDKIKEVYKKFMKFQVLYPSKVVPRIAEISSDVGDACRDMYLETDKNVRVTYFNGVLIIMRRMKD